MDDLEGEKEIKQDVGVVLDECFFHDSLRAKDVGVILAPCTGVGTRSSTAGI